MISWLFWRKICRLYLTRAFTEKSQYNKSLFLPLLLFLLRKKEKNLRNLFAETFLTRKTVLIKYNLSCLTVCVGMCAGSLIKALTEALG